MFMVHLGDKEIHGLHDDLKIIQKQLTHGLYRAYKLKNVYEDIYVIMKLLRIEISSGSENRHNCGRTPLHR